MELKLLVIRTGELDKLKNQYELLGFKFDYHRHGNGPFHYASEENGFVFEIYPLTKSMDKTDSSIRLGFDIENIESKLKELESSDWRVISSLSVTEWGLLAVVQDLDGRKVELRSK